MRWLVVGDGLHYLRALRDIGEQELAIIEPDRAKNRAAWEIVGKSFAYHTRDDVRKTPDVVILCTPTADHVADVTHWAGAHLVVAPPVSLAVQDRDALLAAVQRDRLGMVACPLRFHPGVKALAGLHQSGHFGDVYLGYVKVAHNLTRYASWRGQRAQSGGLTYDHADVLDVLRWAFGEPISLRASRHGSIEGGDIEAAAHAVIQFPSALVTIEAFITVPGTPYRLGLQLVGHKADRPPLVIPAEAADGSGAHLEADAEGWALAYRQQVEHWRKAINGEEDPVQEFLGGLPVTETLMAMDASASQGMGVQFNRGETKAAA